MYHLDENPVRLRQWNELFCVRTCARFFAAHRKDFREQSDTTSLNAKEA